MHQCMDEDSLVTLDVAVSGGLVDCSSAQPNHHLFSKISNKADKNSKWTYSNGMYSVIKI